MIISKKIAIIGASYLQKPLVDTALKQGYEVICFSWEEGAVCKDICSKFYPISIIEKEKILEVCRKENIDAVLTIASDVAVVTVNYVAYHLGLIGNSLQSTLYSTNKYEMRKRLEYCDVKVPYFKNSDSYDNIEFPVVVKPVDSSGSRGISIVKNRDDLEDAIIYAKKTSLSNLFIIEQYIKGKEISVEVISHNGKHHYITSTDKVTSGFPNFVELEQHQPSIFEETLIEEIKEVTFNSLDALKIENGASHTELMITDKNEIYCIEVGARMGGDFIGSDLVQLSTGYDFLKGVLDISLGQFKFDNFNKISKKSGVFFVSSKTKNIIDVIKSDKYIDEIVEQNVSKSKDTLKNSSDRYGYFIYQSNTKIILN